MSSVSGHGLPSRGDLYTFLLLYHEVKELRVSWGRVDSNHFSSCFLFRPLPHRPKPYSTGAALCGGSASRTPRHPAVIFRRDPSVCSRASRTGCKKIGNQTLNQKLIPKELIAAEPASPPCFPHGCLFTRRCSTLPPAGGQEDCVSVTHNLKLNNIQLSIRVTRFNLCL